MSTAVAKSQYHIVLIFTTYFSQLLTHAQWEENYIQICKVEKIAWIQFHHLHLQWKFKLWEGKFAWGVKAKHCWALSTNFWKQKFVDITQQCFALSPQVNFPGDNLNFHWRQRWWDQIQAIFLNLFYFTYLTSIPHLGVIYISWKKEY